MLNRIGYPEPLLIVTIRRLKRKYLVCAVRARSCAIDCLSPPKNFIKVHESQSKYTEQFKTGMFLFVFLIIFIITSSGVS